jgi:hypothetical protein
LELSQNRCLEVLAPYLPILNPGKNSTASRPYASGTTGYRQGRGATATAVVSNRDQANTRESNPTLTRPWRSSSICQPSEEPALTLLAWSHWGKERTATKAATEIVRETRRRKCNMASHQSRWMANVEGARYWMSLEIRSFAIVRDKQTLT